MAGDLEDTAKMVGGVYLGKKAFQYAVNRSMEKGQAANARFAESTSETFAGVITAICFLGGTIAGVWWCHSAAGFSWFSSVVFGIVVGTLCGMQAARILYLAVFVGVLWLFMR